MVAKLNALIDRPASQSHAIGLLLNAAELLAEFDATKSADVKAIAESLDNSGDSLRWQNIATPQAYRMPLGYV